MISKRILKQKCLVKLFNVVLTLDVILFYKTISYLFFIVHHFLSNLTKPINTTNYSLLVNRKSLMDETSFSNIQDTFKLQIIDLSLKVKYYIIYCIYI